MASETFNQYEKEFLSLQSSLSSKLTSLSPSAPDAKLTLNQISRELEEMDEILGTMEIELNTLPPPAKQSLQPKVKAYKDQLKSSKKQFSNLKASNASERDELLGPYGSTAQGGNTLAQDQRSRVLSGTERLADGSRRLEEARRVALDTEQIGISTLEDLNRQRQQLERTTNTLNTADSWIAKSQGVLKSMQRRLQQNRMLQYALIAVLVIIILVIVFFKIAG